MLHHNLEASATAIVIIEVVKLSRKRKIACHQQQSNQFRTRCQAAVLACSPLVHECRAPLLLMWPGEDKCHQNGTICPEFIMPQVVVCAWQVLRPICTL